MSYLLGGGQIVVGLAILAAWWIALTFLGSRWRDKPMTAMRFAVVPSFFLLFGVAGFILILHGLGAI